MISLFSITWSLQSSADPYSRNCKHDWVAKLAGPIHNNSSRPISWSSYTDYPASNFTHITPKHWQLYWINEISIYIQTMFISQPYSKARFYNRTLVWIWRLFYYKISVIRSSRVAAAAVFAELTSVGKVDSWIWHVLQNTTSCLCDTR